ncbi:MAG: AMP-binding protein, partial [bacterium]|nr:AMP-binding protein [bacterium]
EFNRTEAEYPKDKTIHELFEEQVGKVPDKIAVIGPTPHVINYKPQTPPGEPGTLRKIPSQEGNDVTITYRELNRQSTGLACVLRLKGIKPGTIAAIMVERSLEMIIGILGILKAGGAYMPIRPDYPVERIHYMLKDSGTRVLVADPGISGRIKIVKNQLSIVNCQQKTGPYLPGQESHLAPGAAYPTHPLTHSPTHLCYIIYTSGTTGKPKGVLITHKNVVRLMVNNNFIFDFDGSDTWTMFHSYGFDFSVWEMYGALLYGGKLVLIPEIATLDLTRYLEILKREQVTVLNQTPTVFYHLASRELKNSSKQLQLKYVIFGGEALQPAKLREWKEK